MPGRTIRIDGGLVADQPLRLTLPDGRVVTVSHDGSVEVLEKEGGWNRYRVDLPTFEYIARHCDEDAGSHGAVLVTAWHHH